MRRPPDPSQPPNFYQPRRKHCCANLAQSHTFVHMAHNTPRDNARDVTPDDFDHLDVPSYEPQQYQPQAETTQFEAPRPAGNEPTEQLRVSSADYPATETVAVNREPAYVPPAEPAYIPPAEPVYETPVATETVVEEPVAKRGTIDLGLLLLRLCFGAYLIITALATFFGWGANEGISGLENAYAAYPYGNGLAIIVPTLELAAGVFLVLGLITPVAAAVALVVTAFNALHAIVAAGSDWNVFQWGPAEWLPVMLLSIALAMQFTGPGYYGIDAGRSWARRPLASSWIWVVVALALAGVMWWFGTEVNPFA